MIASDYVDSAESEQLFITSSGESLKPDDYIESFTRYVNENESKLDALELIRKKPADLSLKDLKQLSKVFRRQPESYSIKRLNTALNNTSNLKM